MALLTLQPHTISFCIHQPSYEDEDGNLHVGESTWTKPLKCDAVMNGNGNERTFEDGVKRGYSYTIHMPHYPKDMRDLEIGEIIRLNLGGKVQEFEIKGFHRYQLQVKAWV